MNNIFDRTIQLIGEDNFKIVQNAKIAVFGLGGVGSYVVESLARSGVRELILVDNDVISKSNINRQIYALNSTVGRYKVNIAKERILDINFNCNVKTYPIFFDKNTLNDIDLSDCDYIIDAIDTVTSKLLLIEYAKSHNIPIICCMGTGNKLDPSKFKIEDISKTSVCPLARVIRKELKDRKIKNVKVLYSEELPVLKTRTPASISFVPSVAGLLISSFVINDIIKKS